MPTRVLLPSSSSENNILIKTPHTNATMDRYFDIKGYKKLFWSIDNTNNEDRCWITVALVAENGSQTNLFANNLGVGGQYGIVDVGDYKQIRFYKQRANYTTISFTCFVTNDENLNNIY